MKHSWTEFFQDCDSHANVTIVCRNGVIKTHKLILANLSKFTESLMKDVPASDEVTLYLRHFTTLEVDLFLRKPESDPTLSTLFGIRRTKNLTLKEEVNEEKQSSIVCKEEQYEEHEFDSNFDSERPKLINFKQKSKTQKSTAKRERRDNSEIESVRAKHEEAINAIKRYVVLFCHKLDLMRHIIVGALGV